MKAVAVPLQQLISKVKDNANAFVFSVLVVSYQALEAEFPCSCKPQPGYCSAYMIMPCLIIAVLMLSTDLPFQRAWRYTRSKGSCHFGCVLFRRSVKAVCIGLLWVGSVLIQADWFVCCNNQNPRQVAELQCQTKTDVTAAGTAVVTIAEMKMVSRMIGMSLLFAVFFTAAFLLSTWTVYADVCCPKCCRRDVQVHELILEVGEDVVERVMKEEQHSKLSESVKGYIAQGKWVNCLDVVEELIDTIGGEKETTPAEVLRAFQKEDHHEDKKSQQNEEEDSV